MSHYWAGTVLSGRWQGEGLSRPARAPVTLKTLLCLTDKQPPVRDPGAQWPSVQPVAARHWAIPPAADVSEFTRAAEENVADRGVELVRGSIRIDSASAHLSRQTAANEVSLAVRWTRLRAILSFTQEQCLQPAFRSGSNMK